MGFGSTIMWLGQNSDRLLEVVLAAAKLGAIVGPANWRLSPSSLADLIDDFQPKAVFWQQEEVGEQIKNARELAKHSSHALWGFRLTERMILVQTMNFSSFCKPAPLKIARHLFILTPPLMQIYTAGFDGQLKGALMSHRAILQQSVLFAGLQDIDATMCS